MAKSEKSVVQTNVVRYFRPNAYGEATYHKLSLIGVDAGESCVDVTNFRPSAESVRAVLLSQAGVPSVQSLYDFMDGKDTGYRPYRNIGADIVDIQVEVERIQKELEEKKTLEDADKRTAEELKLLGKSITDALVSYGSPESDEPVGV